jgi:hypothetical protein
MAKKTETTAAPKRTRRTKAEIEQEFEALQEEVANSVPISSKQDEFTRLHEQEIREIVNEIGIDNIAQKLSNLNLEISRAFSQLSEKFPPLYTTDLCVESFKQLTSLSQCFQWFILCLAPLQSDTENSGIFLLK